MLRRLLDIVLPRLAEATVKVEATGSVSKNGTGFFVGPGLILTCKHNVMHNDLLLDVTVKAVRTTDGKIEITEYKPSVKVSRSADVALLRVDNSLNAFVVLDERVSYEQKLVSYAFQSSPSQVTLEPVQLTYKGTRLALGQSTLKGLCLGSEQRLQPEMSGSPILNCHTLAVCGMLYRRFNTGSGGIGCPLETILSEFPELKSLARRPSDWRWKTSVWAARVSSLSFDPRTVVRAVYIAGLATTAVLLATLAWRVWHANQLLFSRPGPSASQPLFDVIRFSPTSHLQKTLGTRAASDDTFAALVFPLKLDRELAQMQAEPTRTPLNALPARPALAVSENLATYTDDAAVQNECRKEARRRRLTIASPPFSTIGTLTPPETCRLFLERTPTSITEAISYLEALRRWKTTTYYDATWAYYYIQVAAGTWYSNNNKYAEPLISTSIFTGLQIPLEGCAKFGGCVASELDSLTLTNGPRISASLPKGEPDVGTHLAQGPYLDAKFAVGGSLRSVRLVIALRERPVAMLRPLDGIEIGDLAPYSGIVGPLDKLDPDASWSTQLATMLSRNVADSAPFDLPVKDWHLLLLFAVVAAIDGALVMRKRRARGRAQTADVDSLSTTSGT